MPAVDHGKLTRLEAVRGLAAFSVVLSHLIYTFYPVLKTFEGNVAGLARYPFWVRAVAVSPLSVFHDGRFAVHVFFVLSGFVLSLSYLKSRDRVKLAEGAVRRYFRLMPPVLASAVLSWIVMTAGLYFDRDVHAFIGGDWLPQMPANGSLWSAVYEGLLGAVFAFDFDKPSFNAVLWTMQVEFQGAMLVFGLLAAVSFVKPKTLGYAFAFVAILATHNAYMMSFLFGIMLCALYARLPKKRTSWCFAGPAIVAGLFFGGLRPEWLKLPGVTYWDTAGATLLIGGVLFGPTIKVLEGRLAIWLGKISFGLYLTHYIVTFSAGCAAYLIGRGAGFGHDASAAFAFVVTIALSFVAAWLMYRFADAPAVVFSRRVSDLAISA